MGTVEIGFEEKNGGAGKPTALTTGMTIEVIFACRRRLSAMGAIEHVQACIGPTEIASFPSEHHA